MTEKNQFLETISCPICKSSDFAIIKNATYPDKFDQDFLENVYKSSSDSKLMDQLVLCGNCQLKYVNPRLRSDILVGSYEGGQDPEFVHQDSMRIETFRDSLKDVCQKFNVSPKLFPKVLDIGCAGGAFLMAAKSLGFDPTGIEPSKWLSEFGRRTYGVNIIQGTLENVDLQPASFDIVTLWDVIEHLPDPTSILEKCRSLLKPNGLLLVNYPDVHSFPAKLMGAKWPFFLSVHVTYYDRSTIGKQLAVGGFKAEHFKRHWQTLPFGYVLKRAEAYFGFFRMFRSLAKFCRIESLPFRYYLGQIQVVARKV